MDALKMPALDNKPYSSVTDCHHGCGHDGHVACLVAGGEHIFNSRHLIP